MRRTWMLLALALVGCSLIVPGEDDLTFDLDDAGPEEDAGPEQDSGPEEDAGPERDSGPTVDAGADGGLSCAAGETVCDGACADTETSLEHCGGCGNSCAATDRCDEGSCYDPVVEVAAGYGHSCARRASGQVWCWGRNPQGQLGDSTMLDRLLPVRVVGIDEAEQIGCGAQLARFALAEVGYSCARLASGTVRCWGSNGSGQLGDTTTENRAVPVDVVGLGVSRYLSVGAGLGCSVSPDEQLYCWGGVDDTGEARPPAPLSPTGVTGGWAERVSLHITIACVSGTSGDAFCWGSNSYGQLGTGVSDGSSTVPVRVEGVSDAIDVVPALNAACSLLRDGTVACWGRADALGAGVGTMDAHPSPIMVPGLADVVAIDGGTAICAIHGVDRRVSCWGDQPVRVDGISGAVDVAMGVSHGCVALEDGTAMCWGNNDHGQLGDGTADPREGAVLVRGLR